MSRLPGPIEFSVLSVSALTRYIRRLMDGDPLLSSVRVRGEVSNFKHHSSGHMYFTLKDEYSSVKCVMFRSNSQQLTFRPQNGLRVVAHGYVSVYEREGLYQLYVQELEEDGLGALHRAFQELKARLESLGFFDPSRKRALPLLPRKVGVITSLDGAAIRDILSVSQRRFPNVHLVVAPVPVQGADAPRRIVEALKSIARVSGVDVVIVGRGGGSIEELWAFNDVSVAEAIYASPVPVVSAVGHETDVTIADLVADVRAATPSAAAEVAVPSKAELVSRIRASSVRLVTSVRGRWQGSKGRLELIRRALDPARAIRRLDRRREDVDSLFRAMNSSLRGKIERLRARFEVGSGRLMALSPTAVLTRGYVICLRADSRVPVKSSREIETGDDLTLVFGDGEIDCKALGKKVVKGE